jgi:hypothetical protein
VLLLGLTASKFNRLPSEWVGIDDYEFGRAFDLRVGEEMIEFENEKWKTEIEAMTGQAITREFTGGGGANGVREITPSSNIGDQSW